MPPTRTPKTADKTPNTPTRTPQSQRHRKTRTQPRLVLAAQRREKALQLRAQGYRYREIAEAVGYNDTSAAWNAVKQALDELRERTCDQADRYRILEDQRLDMLAAPLWQRLTRTVTDQRTGDETTEPNYRAIDRLIRIAERRARLWGLDETDRHRQSADDAQAVADLTAAAASQEALMGCLTQLGLTDEQWERLPQIMADSLAAADPQRATVIPGQTTEDPSGE